MSEAENAGVSTSRTRVEMTQIVLPGHTNNHGTIFGGQLVAWVDICASVAAQRFCRGSVVTAAIDELGFKRPVMMGEIVVLEAQVNQAWGSSMEIGVRVEAENPRSGERIHCCSAYLTFVNIADGRPQKVPKLLVDEGQERRAREAEERREARLLKRKGGK